MHRFDTKRLGVKVDFVTVNELWSRCFSNFVEKQDKLALYKDKQAVKTV